MNSKIN